MSDLVSELGTEPSIESAVIVPKPRDVSGQALTGLVGVPDACLEAVEAIDDGLEVLHEADEHGP